jgi:arylsulfatase A-like enzyme
MKFMTLLTIGLSISMFSVFGQEKPNVLFIAIDDLNDYVNSMNGSLKIPTPNIDRLVAKGTIFTNAHCQAPICGPSRASVMTGLYPSTTGNYLQLSDLNIKRGNDAAESAVFMPDYFEEQGYKTMAVGKIYHNGDAANTFDEYGGKFSWYGPRPNERIHYDPSKMNHKVGNTSTDWGAYPEHDSLMTDFQSAAWAERKLRENHDQPFFLAVGFIRPHVPWYVPQKWYDMFPLDSIKTPPYKKNDFDDIPPFARKVADAPMMPTTEELLKSGEWRNVLQAYMACVAFADAQVGKVLDALERSQYEDNTIVVLWADHGYHLGEKNRFAKQALWERDTRTLLVFKEINGKEGQTCSAPVQLLDIYPTLLDMCKLPHSESLEGHSLMSLIQNPRKNWKYPSLSFYGEGNIAIRDERFRLIQYEDGSLELYDMKNDPNEWNNLANDDKYKRKVRGLRKFISSGWAPLSAYSKYEFNEYFIEKSSANERLIKE